MGTNNFIIPTNSGGSGTGDGTLPTSQPSGAGFWNDNGVPKFFDGSTNKPVDTKDGQLLDAFGTDLGIDI